ncbi:serine hydrolase domain-containing protein [Saccharomonospora sp. NPDC046836]|uniref:serine hydrolase domain-containing protein n=1 Tax=Saccharomonospora sp. NPDC046836 TaxID=3156921 RepID=UPI0033E5F3A2
MGVSWRWWCVGLVAGVLFLAAAPAGAMAGQPPNLERYLVDHMRVSGAPGLSYALIHGGDVVSSGAWGYDGYGRPMTPRTPVGFGSVAKPVTATAVLRMVDAGTIGLDDPVVRHLPWFRLADQNHAIRITVRHLLEQTSGISSRDGFVRSDLDDNAPGAISRWVTSLADVAPTAAPGERHQYSPANATILAAMTEEVTGLSFSEVIRREVFTPLDMADGIADARDAERMPPGHEYYFGSVRAADRTFDTSGLAYGYLAGSVTDLAHLAIPLLDNGRYRDTQFLTPGTIAALQHSGPKATCGHYPLGWRHCTLATVNTPIVWHAGAVTGYHTALITAPETGWAIAVQQNVYSPLHDPALNAAAFGALTIALGGTPAPIPGNTTEPIALVALGVLALVLAGALAWSSYRLLARRPHTWRTWLATAGWSGLGSLSAVVAGLLLPGIFDLELRHVVRFMPDIGHLAIAIIVLGLALTVTRLAILLLHLRQRRPHRPTRLQN